MDKIAVGGIGCVFVLALVAIFMVIEVAIAVFAWNIFVVPFFGMPEMTWLPALGLVLLVNLIGGAFRTTHSSSKDK